MKHEPEKVIQKRILDWLKRTDLLHWRQNSGSLYMGNRMVKLGPAGLPDIVVILAPYGRFLGLEVKTEVGRMRPEQIEFSAKASETGALYRVVRSLMDAQAAVREAVGEERWTLLLPSLSEPPKAKRKRKPTPSRNLKSSASLRRPRGSTT